MNCIILTGSTISDYIPVFVQIFVTAGVIFGGTGFWQWKQSKDQAKRDAESKETGVENKIDVLSADINSLGNKVDQLSIDMQTLKKDLLLLQQANEATIKYRELRDKNDKRAAKVQGAVVESLKGMLRERLLDNYNKCIAKGYYSKEEREIFGEMFKCYESDPFNGNGVMHDLRPIIKSLPWTAEEAGTLVDEDAN